MVNWIERFLTETGATLSSTSFRLLRLLALYRCVVAIALAIASANTSLGSVTYAAASAYAVWSLFSVFTLRQFTGGVRGLLLAQLTIDLVLITVIYVDSPNAITTYATYLYPILAAHGWFLRSRRAFGHAAFAGTTLLLTELMLRSATIHALTQATLVSAGYFLLSAIGILLGRSAEESEQKVKMRTADVRRLAHINQVVINELEDGVLVVGATGQVVMANPQATRWLGGDEAQMLPNMALNELSPQLHTRWQSFFGGQNTTDTSPIRTDAGRRLLAPRMMPVDLEARAGTLIFLEDVEQSEAQAQQIKLAALGRLSASIAHEIRNPLSAIKQAAQLIGEESLNLGQSHALIAMIDKNVTRIDRIVRDVSLLGRRDRGAPTIFELEPILSDIIKDLCSTLPASISAFRVAPLGRIGIYADRGHFEEMMVNLLSNAWRHSQQKDASVTVLTHVDDQKQFAIINVIDDGPGVAVGMADRIFEPFYSGSGSTGLGLYLVRELALANGGSVRLGLSKTTGARFVLELPLMQSH